MTTNINTHQTIDSIKAELDHGYQLSQLHQSNGLRHARGWVGTVIDYVLLCIPLVAPIPNLLNLRIALTPVMGVAGSTIAAVAFELLLFGSAEIILYLQDRQMRRGGYELALKIAIACGSAFVVILIVLIAMYEVPLHGWAVMTLPLVSVIAIAFLSLKRWADIKEAVQNELHAEALMVDERIVKIESEAATNREKLVAKIRSFEGENERLLERIKEHDIERTNERNDFARTVEDLRRSLESFEASTSEKNAEIAKLRDRIVELREQSAEQRGQLKNQSNERPKKRSRKTRTITDEQQIMDEIFNHYSDNPKSSLGNAQNDLGYAKSTISKYLDKLSQQGKVEKGIDGKWTTLSPAPKIEVHVNGTSAK